MIMEYKYLFNATYDWGHRIPNRFIRSATWEGYADDHGGVTEKLLDYYRVLSESDLGIIITSHCYVSEEGKASPWQIGAYHDNQIPGLTKLSSTIKKHGSFAVMQIAHGGCCSIKPEYKKLTDDLDVDQIMQCFVSAARRAFEAGFDAVQIHAAHGYLLSQFMSGFYNERTDKYGPDSAESRSLLTSEIIRAIKREIPELSIFLKMNTEDFTPYEMNELDVLRVAVLFEKAGAEAIELSGGTQMEGYRSPVPRKSEINSEEDVYYRQISKRIKNRLSIPIILVGGIRSINSAADMINSKCCDYISLSRPLIAEPNLVSLWNDRASITSKCISCNQCFKPARNGMGLRCLYLEK